MESQYSEHAGDENFCSLYLNVRYKKQYLDYKSILGDLYYVRYNEKFAIGDRYIESLLYNRNCDFLKNS